MPILLFFCSNFSGRYASFHYNNHAFESTVRAPVRLLVFVCAVAELDLQHAPAVRATVFAAYLLFYFLDLLT
jgi:hypothetical protein